MSKPAALQLLNLYGKEEEQEQEQEQEQNDDDVDIKEVSNNEGVEQTVNPIGLSIVDYDHDDDEEDHKDSDENGSLNIGRAVITPLAPISAPLPSVCTPPQVQTPQDTSSTCTSFSGGLPTPLRSDAYLPPEPQGECDARVLAKIKKFYEMKKEGKSINESLRQSKAFRNPDILEKLVVYCNINEIGSNYPLHLWNPAAHNPEDFYDAIAAEQRRMEERRDQERSSRTQVEFVSPSITRPVAIPSNDNKKSEKDNGKKKSKWDSMEPVGGKVPPVPPEISSAPVVASSSSNSSSSATAAPTNAYFEYAKQRKKREAELKTSDTSKKQKQH